MTAPPFAYYGGKTTLAGRIAALLPEHRHYVEPFAGSLAVLLAKPPAIHETVNDLDQRIMTFWRVLRDRTDDLVRVCYLTPHARAEHQAAYEQTDDELETARRVWVLLSQGRGHVMTATGWRHYNEPGSPMSMPRQIDRYVQRMGPVVERIRRVSLECRDALDVIERYGRHAGVCIYADPPYLGSTRSSTGYGVEMPSEADHERLAGVLQDCRAAVVLSGYHSPLYDALYAGWHVHEIAAMTTQANIAGRRTEVLWSNRPFGQGVLDFGEVTA
jgi:DNA adenine methylase